MLETIWFILWGVLWAVYFLLDGYDLGVGILMPFLGKDANERRVMVNTMGPFWDGNEVWLLTAGGVTFAAFPGTYAVMFSSLYTPLMLLLFSIILRGIAFEFRGKVESPAWVKLWDGCIAGGSFAAALLLGVAFANIFQGVPIDKAGILQGNLLTLLNPYGLIGGVLFVLLFVTHGALWLTHMTEGSLNQRALNVARTIWPLLLVVAVTFLIATWFATPLYKNYLTYPALWIIPLLAVVGLVALRFFIEKKNVLAAFAGSGLTIVAATLFGVIGLYPNLLPSSIDPAASMTAFNSASSPLTLKIMLGVALVMVPIVIAYQIWVHVKFSTKVKLSELFDGESF